MAIRAAKDALVKFFLQFLPPINVLTADLERLLSRINVVEIKGHRVPNIRAISTLSAKIRDTASLYLG
jgi:hypothetical protein